MLQAMNTGHDGSLSTVHANSPRDALSPPRDDGADGRARAARARDPQQISSALDLIVHLERLEDGSRRVTHITEVQRMEADVITLQDIFAFKVESITADRTIVGELEPTGLRPLLQGKFEKRGIELPLDIFAPAGRRELDVAQGRAVTARLTGLLAALDGGRSRCAPRRERSRPRSHVGPTLSKTATSIFPQRRTCSASRATGSSRAQRSPCSRTASRSRPGASSCRAPAASRAGAVLADRRLARAWRATRSQKAIDAARAFATSASRRASSSASIPFNNKTPVVLPFTNDQKRIANTLAKPPTLAYGTRIDDAVAGSVADARRTPGSRSDRSSCSPTARTSARGRTTDRALAAAKEAGARIFSVGLELAAVRPEDALGSTRRTRRGVRRREDARTISRRSSPARPTRSRASTWSATGRSPGPARRSYVSVRVEGQPRRRRRLSTPRPGLTERRRAVQQSWWDRLIQSGWFADSRRCDLVVG